MQTDLENPQSLLARFENGEVEAKDFRHEDHVCVAWSLLRAHDFAEAASRMRLGLSDLIRRAGRAGLYHETVTLAFMSLVYERLASARDLSWPEFAAANADLLRHGALAAHYSDERIKSDLARKGFLLPDKWSAETATACADEPQRARGGCVPQEC